MCATSKGSTRHWRRGTWSRSCRRSLEVEDGGSSRSHYRHKEGRVRRRGGEGEGQLRAARALRARRPRVRDADRYARHTTPVCLELQSILRLEGVAVDEPGEDV